MTSRTASAMEVAEGTTAASRVGAEPIGAKAAPTRRTGASN